MLSDTVKNQMLLSLKRELVSAMGCTEPIALSFAGAKAREILGEEVQTAVARCSGNIIKNVRCVTIPNSDGMVGIEAAVAMGIAGGDTAAGMEVIAHVTEEQRNRAKELVQREFCRVELLKSGIPLHIHLILQGKEHRAEVEIRRMHTNIVLLKRDDTVLFKEETGKEEEEIQNCWTLTEIKEFADTVALSEIRDIVERQIECNLRIAEEGLKGKYGLGIGKELLESCPDCLETRIKAWAAAASEARMGGCDLPVVINAGSGNQGITSSVPVVIYAREKGIKEEKMYRALVFSALLTLWQKSYIGRLSAFCGAVSAACASGAAMTYLDGGSLEEVARTISNTLADVPGIICDGAKISCAAKIASCLNAAYMAHCLAENGKAYQADSGILKKTIEDTVSCVGQIGREGMHQTDIEILELMLQK